jgi:nucleoside-diphosphate-sugar epimerase
VRPFNTYGPRQSARAVIPTIISQLLAGASEIKLGSLHPTRDLTFVSDSCGGFIALAESDSAVGRDVNLGVGQEITIGELAGKLIDQIAPGTPIVCDDTRLRPEKSEVERLLSDNSLARGLSGWKPQVSLDEGLARTVEWMRDSGNLSRYKWDHYNV